MMGFFSQKHDGYLLKYDVFLSNDDEFRLRNDELLLENDEFLLKSTDLEHAGPAVRRVRAAGRAGLPLLPAGARGGGAQGGR